MNNVLKSTTSKGKSDLFINKLNVKFRSNKFIQKQQQPSQIEVIFLLYVSERIHLKKKEFRLV